MGTVSMEDVLQGMDYNLEPKPHHTVRVMLSRLHIQLGLSFLSCEMQLTIDFTVFCENYSELYLVNTLEQCLGY